MKQKIKQLQSSGETRKTSRTWHFLSTLNSLLLSKLLLLLIIPAIGSTAAWADDTYYYGCMNLTNGALTPGTTNTTQFVKGGATLTSSTDLSLSSTPGTGGIYYNSSSLSASSLGTSSNWGTGSSSDRRIRGLKFASGTNYTLALGTKVATSITFYGWCGSESRTLTIGGVSYGTPSTKNEFFHNEFTKDGNFTGNVTISQDGDMYGILVIVVSSTPATPTTTTLTVDPDEGSVYVGKTLDIHGYVETNSNATVTYTSSNGSVATVTSAGVISGVAEGKTTITVAQAANASYTAASETFTITVNAAPTQYTITLAANDNDMGYVTAIYNVADDYNDKEVNDEFTSGTKVSSGTRLTITAHPNTGYEFNETANPSVDGGVTKYRPWGNATGSTTATFTTATLDNGDKTYTAHFKAKTYAITLDKGTGGSDNGSATATYNSNTLTSVTDATHATLTLKGYYTAASDGTKVINANGSLVASTSYTDSSGNWTYDGNVKLYAQWEAAATYTVTYNANGLTLDSGAVPTDATAYAEGATVTVKGNTGSLAKDGYTFLGWSTALGYQSTYYTADQTFAMGTANVTLYAQWKLNSSLVSSDPAPGAGTLATGAPVYTTATSPATGMYAEQAADEFDFATLKTRTLKGLTAEWTNNSSNAGGTQTLSVLLTDGTFYSDVIPFTYTVGVATPVISCSSNTVTITCATTGATIYYTTDGSTPSASNGTEYSTSFPIYVTTTVKAIAIKNATNSAVASQDCVYATSITALPVTIDFGASPFEVGMSFAGASGKTMSLTQNSHEVYFHGSNQTEFSIVSGSPNALRMNSNGATNHFIAIPMSNINGRIDIEVWAPYTDESNFTIRAVLDTNNGTTVQSAAPSAIKTAALDVNDYKDGHFYFRMKDITATSGVLYIGPASSSYKDFQKIKVTSPAHYLIPDKASVTMGDGSEPETVTITNYSAYPVLVKTVPSYVTATFEPSTGVLVITPKAIGTGGAIELAVDTNGDGIATSTDLSIPVTVTGITIGTQPVSKVYKDGGDITALSVSATNSGAGSLTYQWYKNTVNSTTGGEKVGSNSASYTPSLTAEANAFYYCEVSADGAQTKTSDVAYVLYSNSKRYFQMSNVAGNKSTSETEAIDITGQVIAGGVATYTKNTGDGKYVLRVNTQPHYFHTKGDAVFKIELPSGTSVKSDDVISVTLNAINGNTRGLTISASPGFSNPTDFTTSSNEGTVVAKTGSAANLTGATALYIKGYNGADGYFTDLILRESAPLVVTAPTPASQNVQTGDKPAAISVTATGGSGSYTYQWYWNTENTAIVDDAHKIDGATSASYIPTATSGTTYYYCLVNSQETPTGYASVTFTALSHGYMTIDGTEHSDQKYSFDNNEFKYFVNQSNYTSQNVAITDGQNQKFWELDSSPKWATKGSYTNAADIKAGSGSNAKFVNLYIKDAVAFKVLALNSASRTYDIYVDGKKVATSQSANPSIESPIFALNKGGSKIEFNNAKEGNNDSEVQIAYIIFYEKAPATINIMKNGEEVTADTKYMGDGATEYEVETNGDGNLSLVKPAGAEDVAYGYRTTYAEVTLKNGILSVTPLATTPTNPSTPEVITINHTGSTSYADASTTLNVTVKKHTLALAFSYDKASFKASTLTSDSEIPGGSLPTLTATRDGVEVTGSEFDGLGIRYMSDDITIGSFASPTSYAITYGGGQGGARIYAYVGSNANVSSAKAYFDLVVEDGTSNALPSTAQAGSGDDKQIYEQKQFRMANSQGVEVVRLTYGGYKYGAENGWRDAEKKGEYYIDGYPYYTRHGMDALDEYGYQLRGMSDEEAKPSNSADNGSYYKITKSKVQKDDSSCTFNVNRYGNQNVGSHAFWYTTSETKPGGGTYSAYERIHPFTLPTRGGYLKFEPKQTGKLTVYVWQNGVYSGDALGSKPRLGYWFDQDGWVQHPTVAPVTKQPLSVNMGSDHIKLTTLSNWTTEWEKNGDDAIKPLLTNKWCSIEKPTWENALTATYSNAAEKPAEYYENPFYWMKESEIGTNLNEEETIISKKMTPVPFHNGYMVPEASYLKYVLNVVAGKTYYFYGMMTKVGYVGMNFVQDEVVDAGDDYTSVAETLDVDHQSSRHLNAADNMSWVSGLSHAYTVYDEVTLPSNYKKGQWSTICLPFALSESQVEEAFGKGTQLTIYNGARKKGTGVYSVRYLSHVDRNILAGQPYFIKPSGVDANKQDLPTDASGVIGSAVDGASGTRITFNTVVVDKAHFSTSTNYGSNKDVNASGTDIDQYGYEFVGSTNNDKLPTYSYIVSGGKLRQFTGSNTKIPTYYAYLKPHTTEAQSGSFSLTVDFNEENVENAWVADSEDDPTGVISMEAIADAMNNGKVLSGKAYNMMGQEVDPTSAKGIVIIDGKKYMFK